MRAPVRKLYILAPLLLLPGAALAEPPGGLAYATPFGVLGFVALLAWGLARYAGALRADYVRLAADAPPAERLAAFRDSPAGLPDGSVRAALAVAIVLLCLPALVLSQALGLGGTGELGTILGGVIGFYFGSRGAGEAESRRRPTPAAEAPPPAEPASRAGAVLAAAARAAPAVEAAFHQASPASIAAALAAASQAVEAAGEDAGFPPQLHGVLRTAQVASEAAVAVEQALDAPDQGLGAALAPVLRAFAAVPLPGATPAALAGGLLLGAWQAATVGRAHQARWMARVLDRPVTPEMLPTGAWDGEAARALLEEIPVLGNALADRLAPEAPQSAPATVLARLLEPDGPAWLRAEHPDLGPAGDAAVAQLRRRVLDEVLDRADLRPAGGLSQPALRAGLDRLREGGAGGAVQALGRLAEGLAGSGPDLPARIARALSEAEAGR